MPVSMVQFVRYVQWWHLRCHRLTGPMIMFFQWVAITSPLTCQHMHSDQPELPAFSYSAPWLPRQIHAPLSYNYFAQKNGKKYKWGGGGGGGEQGCMIRDELKCCGWIQSCFYVMAVPVYTSMTLLSSWTPLSLATVSQIVIVESQEG